MLDTLKVSVFLDTIQKLKLYGKLPLCYLANLGTHRNRAAKICLPGTDTAVSDKHLNYSWLEYPVQNVNTASFSSPSQDIHHPNLAYKEQARLTPFLLHPICWKDGLLIDQQNLANVKIFSSQIRISSLTLDFFLSISKVGSCVYENEDPNCQVR